MIIKEEEHSRFCALYQKYAFDDQIFIYLLQIYMPKNFSDVKDFNANR